MSEYVLPEYGIDGFNCPYCNAYAHHQWGECFDDYELGDMLCIEGEPVEYSTCRRCDSTAFWIDEQMIYPLARMAPPANSDLPDDVKEVYEEAAAIAGLSARAACALLRVAIEMLLKHLGHLEENDNINDSIKKLVQTGLDETAQQALDVVRVAGNNAVHPGTIDFNDPTDVSSLFRLINLIVNRFITDPNLTGEMYADLPEDAKKAIRKRDGKI